LLQKIIFYLIIFYNDSNKSNSNSVKFNLFVIYSLWNLTALEANYKVSTSRKKEITQKTYKQICQCSSYINGNTSILLLLLQLLQLLLLLLLLLIIIIIIIIIKWYNSFLIFCMLTQQPKVKYKVSSVKERNKHTQSKKQVDL
jgi:hypothetical protein